MRGMRAWCNFILCAFVLNVGAADVPTDAFGCKRIDLEAKGKMVSLPVAGVDFTASPCFALDGYITDLSTAGAIYLALIDGKGNKRRYSVCDLEAGHWNVMTFDRDETVWKSADFDWKDVRKANVWVPATVWMPGSTNATVSLWLGNLRSAPGPVAWRAPAAGERRFAWCLGKALGDRGNWAETAAFLAKWKFTDVIVAAGRAGGVLYKSDVVPLAKDALPGDPLREAIAACRPLDVASPQGVATTVR